MLRIWPEQASICLLRTFFPTRSLYFLNIWLTVVHPLPEGWTHDRAHVHWGKPAALFITHIQTSRTPDARLANYKSIIIKFSTAENTVDWFHRKKVVQLKMFTFRLSCKCQIFSMLIECSFYPSLIFTLCLCDALKTLLCLGIQHSNISSANGMS